MYRVKFGNVSFDFLYEIKRGENDRYFVYVQIVADCLDPEWHEDPFLIYEEFVKGPFLTAEEAESIAKLKLDTLRMQLVTAFLTKGGKDNG